MNDEIQFNNTDTIDAAYASDISSHFSNIPAIAKPLIKNAKAGFDKIEHLLYLLPSFLEVVKTNVPEEALRAVLTDEQKMQLKDGVLKLMTKKDGTLAATLVNSETNKIVANIPLEKMELPVEISQALTNYATQMQLAQIAEQIQNVQIAIEDVRQGQESDRLASAYSCQQQFLQASSIKNPQLKNMALLQIVADAEHSRNLLMQSQKANIAFIQSQPESFWGKLLSGANPEKINSRMAEIRESLCAVNMVSLAEALAYQEMGESEAAQISLQYYADYIKTSYLSIPNLVDRLDMIDPSPDNYWSRTLPDIQKKIQALPCNSDFMLIGECKNGTANL